MKDNTKKESRMNKSQFLAGIGGVTLMSTAIVLLVTGGIKLENEKSKYNEYLNNSYTKTIDYDIKTVISYIINNKNLSEKEKDFIIRNLEVIAENQEYVNMNDLNYILPNLSIKYKKGRQSDYNCGSDTLGSFFSATQEIVLFDSTCFEETNKETLLHELNHAFTKSTHKPLGHYLKEALNETITCEYDMVENFSNRHYQFSSVSLYILCEIIGPDQFLKYHFNGDIDIIINSLSEIITDKNKAIELISEIDVSNKYFNEVVNYQYTESIEKTSESYEKLLQSKSRIYKLLNDYYKAKYNTNMMNNSDIAMIVPYLLDTDNADKDMKCKGYFNDNYIESHKNAKYIEETNEINKTK